MKVRRTRARYIRWHCHHDWRALPARLAVATRSTDTRDVSPAATATAVPAIGGDAVVTRPARGFAG